MSNYDFLLDHTDFNEESTTKTENEIIVRGYFYGSEDLSWTKYEYKFTKDGDFIECKELDSYR